MTNQNTVLAAIETRTPSALMDRAAFSQAVALAAMVVEKRNTIPILSNLYLQGDGAGLTVKGTDLDIEITARIDGAADSDFATTIPAHMLKDILGKAKASDMAALDLVSESRAAIDLGGIKFTLQSLDAMDFPEMAAPSIPTAGKNEKGYNKTILLPPLVYSIAAPDLIKGFDRVKFAISYDETRYYLNGAYVHFIATPDGNFLRFVATDGHRLAQFSLPAMAIPSDLPGLIIPAKTIKTLMAVYAALKKSKQAPDTIKVETGTAKIKFTLGNVEILSKVIDGTFPDYSRIMPRHNDKLATLNVKAFDSAVEQVGLISQEKSRAVKLSFERGACTLEMNNPDAGSSETTVATDYASEPLETGFNGRYLRDFMAEIQGEEFTFQFNDSGSPALVLDPSEPAWLGVLMPMRV
jgi:DNA polymerase III subunit beta